MKKTLSILDACVLLAVTFIWGSNFVVIRFALDGFDPMLLAFIRFFLSAFPLVFLVPRPAIPNKILAWNGLLLGPGQFGILYFALQSDITPGLASLLMQTQVFITIILARLGFGEPVSGRQWLGLGCGAFGLAVVGFHIDKSVTLLGLMLVLSSASCWAASNILTKTAFGRADIKPSMFAYIVWSSMYSLPALLIFTVITVGPDKAWNQLLNATPVTWSATGWQAIGNTLIGFAVWGKLLSKYPASIIAPWALLVPVFGISSTAVFLNESFPVWKLTVSAIIIAGVAIISWPAKTIKKQN